MIQRNFEDLGMNVTKMSIRHGRSKQKLHNTFDYCRSCTLQSFVYLDNAIVAIQTIFYSANYMIPNKPLKWLRDNQRNRMHHNLVGLATLAMFVVVLRLVSPGLHGNRQTFQNVDERCVASQNIRIRAESSIKRPFFNIGPVLEGPHLKYESILSSYQILCLRLVSFATFPADEIILIVPKYEKIKGLQVALFGKGLSVESVNIAYMPLQKNKLAVVGLSGDASTLVRNM